MTTMWDRTAASAPLVQAARSRGIAFDSSPTGRWIRIAGQGGVSYVVQDAWGDGCLVLEVGGEQNGASQHFLNADLAVLAAAREAGIRINFRQAQGGDVLAKAG